MPQSPIITPALSRAKWDKLRKLVTPKHEHYDGMNECRICDKPVLDAAIEEIERLRSIASLDPGTTFAEAIKAERQRLDMTQNQAAAFLEVSPRTYWLWESGGNVPAITQEGALARFRNRAKP